MRTSIQAALEEAGFVAGHNVAIEYRFPIWFVGY